MLSSAPDLKGHAASGLTKPATHSTLCREYKSRQLVSNGSSMVLKSMIVAPACSTRDWRPFVVWSSKDGDSGRRAESAICLGLFLKRIMDVVLSTIVLVLLWPLLLGIAIAIKLESPGPVIYPSLRVGKKGRRFVCYKFLTMVPGADELKDTLRRLNQRRGPFFKIADDPRVTRLGRFLRK